MYSVRRIIYIIFSMSFFFCSNAQEKDGIEYFRAREIRGEDNWRTGSSSNTIHYDVKYHRLELEANPAVHYLTGMVTTYFVPVGQNMEVIYFDFKDNMSVDSVIFHGTKLPSGNIHFSTSTELSIELGTTIPIGTLDSVSIFYQGAPISGDFGIFRTAATKCPQPDSMIWTLSEPYGSKGWWPCKETLNDKADSIDIIISTPAKYRVGSNGVLVKEKTQGSNKVYHWRHRYPIPAYLVAFAVADYAVYSDTIDNPLGGEIEVLNYVFKCDSSTVVNQTPAMDPIMKFFINTFGQYPYINEKYGHAQCGFGGGMEHSTMSFMGNFQTYLMAHELAHQWFGDKITCGSWHEIWLNEGFATYLEGLTCEQGIGQQSWETWLSGKINSVLSSPNGSVYNPDTTCLSRIFNGRLSYNKGALLLHMLRWKMGDEDFFDAIYNYINDPALAYGYAHTDDLKAHLEAEYGHSLTEFFNDWYYGEGWPDYEATWTIDPACNVIKMVINQSHSTGGNTFFEMPVPVYFTNGSNDSLVVLNQENPLDTVFYIVLDFTPTSVQLDPDKWLCARHTLSRSTTPLDVKVWNGSIDSDWTEAGNWHCGLPGPNSVIVIPSNMTPCILHSGHTVQCKEVIVQQGGALWIEEGSEIIIEQ